MQLISTNHCPVCDACKALLNTKGVEYEYLQYDPMNDSMSELMAKYKVRSAPALIISEEEVYQGIAALNYIKGL